MTTGKSNKPAAGDLLLPAGTGIENLPADNVL